MESNQDQVVKVILDIKQYHSYDKDVTQALQNEVVNAAVADVEQRYASINVYDTMKKLGTIAELVNLAFIGTHGLSSGVAVVALMSSYQTLASDSKIACVTFVEASFKSLGYHRRAIELVSKNPKSAFKFVSLAAKIAEEMGDVSNKLVEKASTMCTLAQNALEETVKDDAISTKKKAEVHDMILQLEATEASLEVSTKKLRDQIKAAADAEAKASAQADRSRTQAFALALVSAIIQPVSGLVTAKFFPVQAGIEAVKSTISNPPKTPSDPSTAPSTTPSVTPPTKSTELSTALAEKKQKLAEAEYALNAESDPEKKKALEKEIEGLKAFIKSLEEKQAQQENLLKGAIEQKNNTAESAAEREAAYRAERMNLQELELKAAADLEGAVVKLKGMTESSNNLDKAIVALEVAIKSLGRIKTVFVRVREFWAAVHGHCVALADMTEHEAIHEVGDEIMFTDSIIQSWYSWLALCKINHTSELAMEKVVDGVSAVMSDLPTEKEAEERFPALVAKLEAQLKEDRQAAQS